jgi:hypothetical protein
MVLRDVEHRLDEYGIFLNHKQDPSSSKCSDIHRKPMNFSMIRKKIESQDYTSWKSFVVCSSIFSLQ